MPPCAVSIDLYACLERCCVKASKARTTVLFRRCDNAFGMFLVLKGTVALDLGVDGPQSFGTLCGPGALVGLPATLTKGTYSMTATVTDEAELGFISTESLFSLLREYPELCQQLLGILSEKMAQFEKATKTARRSDRPPGIPASAVH